MLILTRRPSESIMIGDEIVVTVLGIHGQSVRIGIRAPKHIAVNREEIFDAKLRDGTLHLPQSGNVA